jgi:hypothetical protein
MADEVDYDEEDRVHEDPPDYTSDGDEAVDSSKGRRKHSRPKVKGRGHGSAHMYDEDRYEGRGGIFEKIGSGSSSGPMQCTDVSYIIVIVLILITLCYL